MTRACKLCAATTVLLSFCVPLLLADEAEAPPKTLEEQILYLEGALSESLRGRDFAMLEMAVKGFKAAKLQPKDLELSMLRAERNAAWASGQQFGMAATSAASMQAWGLMARAMLGDDSALQTLRKMAGDLPPSPGPLPAMNKVKPAEYQAKQRAIDDFTRKVNERNNALLALALLKEPGVQEKALAAIRNKPPDVQGRGMFYSGFGGDSNPLILAVLQSGGEEGLKRLIDYCADEKGAFKDQAQMLGELNTLCTSSPHRGAEDKFSITADIRQRLPQDAQQRLMAPFIGLVKRYAPDPKQQWDMTLNYISGFAMFLPEKALPPEGVAALEELLNKLPGPNEQYPKQGIVAILRKYGKDPAGAVKPPRPPEKAPDF